MKGNKNDKNNTEFYNKAAEAILKAYKVIQYEEPSRNRTNLFISTVCQNLLDKGIINYTESVGLQDNTFSIEEREKLSSILKDLDEATTKKDKLEFINKVIDYICELCGFSISIMNTAVNKASHTIKLLKDEFSNPPTQDREK